jgi:hypothetical protein
MPDTPALKAVFDLLVALQPVASSAEIPKWLALFLRVQVRADLQDAREAEAVPRP